MTHDLLNRKIELAFQTNLKYKPGRSALIACAETVYFKPEKLISKIDNVIAVFDNEKIRHKLDPDEAAELFSRCQEFYTERNLLK